MNKEVLEYNNWLNNFEDTDQNYAKIIFESLKIYTLTDFENSIHNQLSNLPKVKKFALYPLMDQQYFQKEKSYLELLPSRKLMFNKNGLIANNADSEYILMNFIRNYCKPNKHTLNMPLRGVILKQKIRNFVILTDLIASGNQIIDFLNYFLSDSTIKSYRSLHKIEEIQIITHLITDQAYKLLVNRKYKNIELKINFEVKARTINSFFADDIKKKNIENLCKKYSQSKKNELGYGNIGLLSIYDHRIPNNVPAIIIQSFKGWNSLFKQRRVSKKIRKMKEDTTGESIKTILDILLIIKETKKNHQQIISENLNFSSEESLNLINNLIKADYISQKGRLTSKGNNLLRKNIRQKSCKDIDKLVIDKYFPFFKGGGRI